MKRQKILYPAAVSSGFRRRGIGRALVWAAENALKSKGISKLSLVVFSDNKAGNTFWEKLGYAVRTDLTYRDKPLVKMKRL